MNEFMHECNMNECMNLWRMYELMQECMLNECMHVRYGNYSCVAENKLGSAEGKVNQTKPSLISQTKPFKIPKCQID